MPFYSSHPSGGRLLNNLKSLLDSKSISSFGLSRIAQLSPTTTRKIYSDPSYIPSPDVLEKLCISLSCDPGDLLTITGTMDSSVAVCSGV
jgi:DNA-binding Xre family transcriptional regulator